MQTVVQDGGRDTEDSTASPHPGDGERLCLALARALATPARAATRLSDAHTSVAFSVGSDRVALLLDRTPALVVQGADPCESEVQLSPAQARAFACGRYSITSALVRSAVAARGPIRKYLEVDPILRSLLSLAADDPGADHLPDPDLAAAAGRLDPQLLALETRGLCSALAGRPVLTSVDLQIPEGSIAVLLGASGSGKSVLLRHLAGTMSPDRGSVLLRGRALGDMRRSELVAIRREVGLVPQHDALSDRLTVYENVAAALLQVTGSAVARTEAQVAEHLAGLDLADVANEHPSGLSNWTRVRTAVARATVGHPGILLVDEPEAGLDPVRTSLLSSLLVDQHAEYGGTVLVATRDVALARAVAEHLVVLDRGTVVASGRPTDVLASDVPQVRRFLAAPSRAVPGPSK